MVSKHAMVGILISALIVDGKNAQNLARWVCHIQTSVEEL